MDRELALFTLRRFLSFDLGTPFGVLGEFAALPGAVAHYDGDKHNFVYVPGTREDRVLLVAHADTVWDGGYGTPPAATQALTEREGVLWGENPALGIGADDRAGCAMLWLLRHTGHSLLVVDGEEGGKLSSLHIRGSYPDLFDELNRHAYALQLDRCGGGDYKVYKLPVTQEFCALIEQATGYREADRERSTDIAVLCRDICGANLSIGYYDEHTPREHLNVEEWLRTLTLVEQLLTGRQKRFPLLCPN